MKESVLLLFALTLIIGSGCGQDKSDIQLIGPYLGQEPPDGVAKVFAPDVVSIKGNVEFSSTFTPDGTAFYFSRREPGGENRLLFSKLENGKWTNPEVAPFTDGYWSAEANISPDGQYLFFNSRRPVSDEVVGQYKGTVWVTKKSGAEWGQPMKLDENMMYATVSSLGNLYYTDKGSGNIGGALLMKAKFDGTGLTDVSKVEIAGQVKTQRAHPFIAADESYLIFNESGDLYIAFKNDEGEWSSAKKLSDEINTSQYEFAPNVSPDGKYLFFTREGQIFWVGVEVIYE